MKRENLKKASQIETEIEELSKELDNWEKSKAFNSSTKIQVKNEVFGINPGYSNVDLSKIPFNDLRLQFLESLNYKIECLENELEKILNDGK